MLLWKLLHTFGFIAWFVGLLANTGAQVAARKAGDATARRTAWGVMRRYVPYEIVGMVLTPISGLMLAQTKYGSFFPKGVVFIHIKLTLVLIALVANIVVLLQRKKAGAHVEEGGAAFTGALKRMAIFQGIATLMLPLAVLVVLVFLYR